MDSKAREINPPDTVKNKLGMLTKRETSTGNAGKMKKWELKAENWKLSY